MKLEHEERTEYRFREVAHAVTAATMGNLLRLLILIPLFLRFVPLPCNLFSTRRLHSADLVCPTCMPVSGCVWAFQKT